jgi:hypothetical protein
MLTDMNAPSKQKHPLRQGGAAEAFISLLF